MGGIIKKAMFLTNHYEFSIKELQMDTDTHRYNVICVHLVYPWFIEDFLVVSLLESCSGCFGRDFGGAGGKYNKKLKILVLLSAAKRKPSS